MTWYIYALGAAIIWGVHYNLLARAMTTISPLTAYWMPTTIMVLGMPLFYKTLYKDLQSIIAADWKVQLAVSIISFTSFAATMCLYKAIQSHNAVHASLIEITFPVFVAIFAFVFFGQNHFSVGTIIGGLLIMLGAGIIIATQ